MASPLSPLPAFSARASDVEGAVHLADEIVHEAVPRDVVPETVHDQAAVCVTTPGVCIPVGREVPSAHHVGLHGKKMN